MAHKQLYPSYRFHPDGREQIVQTPADDAALTAEDERWSNRPPHGIAHDLAWAERQPRRLDAPSEPDVAETDPIETEPETPADLAPAAKKTKAAKRAKAGPVDKP